MQYDEHWQDKQERGLTRWVNSVFKDAHYVHEDNQGKRSTAYGGWSQHRADVMQRCVNDKHASQHEHDAVRVRYLRAEAFV